MDVNEEIVKQWLQLCKMQFTLESIQFKVYGKRGGSNYSDIDILAIDKDGKYYDYEVKWRSVYSLNATPNETMDAFIKQMTRKERQDKIREVIGNAPYKKIFITTQICFGKREEKKKLVMKEFSEHGIDVIFFEDIIKELTDKIKVKGRYDSPILQIIRMLKHFDLIKSG